MEIKWRPIPYFPDYEVSNTGLVRSLKRGRFRIMKEGRHPKGYRQVGLRRNGVTHLFKVGHLVLLAFEGPCPEGCEMCHNDSDPTNDCLDNLRWDTHVSNMQDMSRQKAKRRTELRGFENISNTVFVGAVETVQKELGMTQEEFSEYLGISQGALSKFYNKGIKDNIVINVLRRFPHLVHHFKFDHAPKA